MKTTTRTTTAAKFSRSTPTAVLFAALVAAGLATPANAATMDWTGTTSGNMSGTPANWGGTIPTGTDVAHFNASLYTNAPTANANLTLGELLFDAGNTAGVTFGTGALTLTLNGVAGVGIQLNSGSGAVSTGSAKFALGASQSWLNNSASAFTVGGTITNSGNVSPFALTAGGTGNTTLSGIISNGGTTGTTALIKNDAGTLTLAGTNTFTGGVTLTTGNLNLNNTKAVGTGTFTINGGTIDTTNTTAGLTAANNAQIWGGDFTFNGTSNFNLGTGTVDLNGGTRTVTTTANTLTVGGIISNGSLTKAGAGALTLSGANTFASGVTLNAGTLNINNAGVLSTNGPLGNGGTFTINGGTIDNTSGSAKVVANVNPITLGGDFAFSNSAGTANNSLSLGGAVSMNGNRTITTNGTGTLTLSGIVADGNKTSGLTLSGTGTLALSGANTYSGGTTVNAGSTLMVGGTGIITSNAVTSGATGTGAVTFANNTSLNSASSANWYVPTITLGGTLNLVGTNRLNLAFKTLELTSGTKTINVNGKSLAVSGNALTGNSETTGLSQWEMIGPSTGFFSSQTIQSTTSTGVLDLETTNPTFISGIYAVMRINNATSFNNTDLIIGNNVLLFAANTGTLGTSAATSPNVTVNGILDLVASAATGRTVSVKSLVGSGSVFGSMVTTNTFTTTLALNGTSASTTFAGTISNGAGTGALSLSKTGGSTQILSGTNTYTGTTTISGGTLQLGAANAIAQSASVVLSGGTLANGGAFNQTFGTLNLTANSTIDLTAGGAFAFADSHSLTWTSGKILTITGSYIANDLRFGTDSGGLGSNLSQIVWTGYTLNGLDASGYLLASAIPEPATYAALAGLGILGFAAYRRRKTS